MLPASRTFVAYFLFFCLLVLVAWGPGHQRLGRLSAQQQISEEMVQQALDTQLPEDPSSVIAVVGRNPILLADVMPKVQARLKAIEKKQGRELTEHERKFGEVNILRGLLQQVIQAKMMGEAFVLKQVGTADAGKRAEVQRMMQGRARKLFFENQVPEMIKQLEVTDLAELDEKLRAEGTSLKTQQRDFIDSVLGQMFLQEMINQDPKVSVLEIYNHYDENQDDYRLLARAKWEQLTVRFDRFPSRQEAMQAIVMMGNEALYGGNMQAVARVKSQEPFANQGGLHDWTNLGSLASTKLEDQIFSLPLNKMSEVIEDEIGFHIVKVVERKPAGIRPISEVQDEIRQLIKNEKIRASEEELLADMRIKVPVWSIFPEDVSGAKPLRESVATRPIETPNGQGDPQIQR